MKEELNRKLLVEYMTYIQSIKNKNKEYIINHAKEIYLKRTIIDEIDILNLKSSEIKKILNSKNILKALYEYIVFSNSLEETVIRENIKECIYVMKERD